MASYNMNPLPDLEVGTTLDQVNKNLKTVKNWLYQLDEQLRYNLYNLEEENFTQETINSLTSVSDDVTAALTVLDGKITAAVTDTDGKFSELQVDIDGITTRVGDTEGNISALQQTASGLTTAVEDAQGNISSLQQTSSSIITQVSNLNGEMSEVQQSADRIDWIVAGGTSQSSMSLTEDFVSMITNRVIISDQMASNYASITVNGYGVYIEPNQGTVYLGSSNGYVYARNSFDAYYIHCTTQITAEGNIATTNGQVGAYSAYFTGWCYSPDWTMGSDRNLKKDIETLPDEMEDFIYSLEPVQYRFKDDKNEKLRFGFIAQDVQEELKAVGYGDTGALVTAAKLDPDSDNETLTLSYTDIIAPLVKAVQSLNERVKALEEKLG